MPILDEPDPSPGGALVDRRIDPRAAPDRSDGAERGEQGSRRGGTLIGAVLDKYEVLQKIGEGGMATVYRGRHTTLGRDVAIKILHPHLSRSERNRARFAREARAIEHLDHDNILKIFDYSGSETEDSYIVTELVDGVTLQQLTAEHGRLPSEVASLICIELAAALAYAHGLGIIHRDLKPENVMLRRDGSVKLMDFGIARFLDEVNLTVTGALVGSPAYMSPEQAMERVLDPRSDLFSMGTLLFHLVSGQLPFAGSNPSIILRNIIEGNRPEVIELASDISAGLADLIERLLQNNQEDRPQNAAAVEVALRQTLRDVSIEPSDPNWNLRAWLLDPAGYEERLKARLREVLLVEGKARLASKDHLGALRLFNRLLSLDEENEEVLQIVQGMHTPTDLAPPPSSKRWWSVGVGAALTAAVATWALWPSLPTPGEPDGVAMVALGEGSIDVENPNEGSDENTPLPDPATGARTESMSVLASDLSHRDGTPPSRDPATVAARSAAPARTGRSAPPEGDRAGSAAAVASVPDEPGTVSVFVREGAWAFVYVDGVQKGRTGEVGVMKVTPGKHTIELRNPMAVPYTRPFEVAPGEHIEIGVDELTPLPILGRFDPRLPDACHVTLDGQPRGTLGALGHALTITDPRGPHSLRVSCPEGPDFGQEVPANRQRPGSTFTVPLP
jgi:serine/threonine protein kinase